MGCDFDSFALFILLNEFMISTCLPTILLPEVRDLFSGEKGHQFKVLELCHVQVEMGCLFLGFKPKDTSHNIWPKLYASVRSLCKFSKRGVMEGRIYNANL